MAYAAAIGLVISVASGIKTSKENKKIVEQTREQNKLNQRKTDVRNARTRVGLIRKARVARAEIEAAAVNKGTAGSSGALGGVGSIGSQVASNIGFVNRVGSIDASITASKDIQGVAATSAAKSQAIGGLGDTIFSTGISRTQ